MQGQSSTIPLRGPSGVDAGVAVIDAQDFARLGSLPWRLDRDGYVMRKAWVKGPARGVRGKVVRVYLHREVMGLPNRATDSRIVDHINFDRLDNTRANLRIVTVAESVHNRRSQYGSSSRYTGVTLHRSGQWQAQVRFDGKDHYLGLFTNEHEAGRVAAAFRAKHMPASPEAREVRS